MAHDGTAALFLLFIWKLAQVFKWPHY